jgi:hypothetical protein
MLKKKQNQSNVFPSISHDEIPSKSSVISSNFYDSINNYSVL